MKSDSTLLPLLSFAPWLLIAHQTLWQPYQSWLMLHNTPIAAPIQPTSTHTKAIAPPGKLILQQQSWHQSKCRYRMSQAMFNSWMEHLGTPHTQKLHIVFDGPYATLNLTRQGQCP